MYTQVFVIIYEFKCKNYAILETIFCKNIRGWYGRQIHEIAGGRGENTNQDSQDEAIAGSSFVKK